jgi:hypothetical protein
LILKSFHLPDLRAALRAEVAQFWASYSGHIDWEPAVETEARVTALLPALMLARIDGKSPVEYLTAPVRAAVRDAAIPLIAAPAETLAALLARLPEGAIP